MTYNTFYEYGTVLYVYEYIRVDTVPVFVLYMLINSL